LVATLAGGLALGCAAEASPTLEIDQPPADGKADNLSGKKLRFELGEEILPLQAFAQREGEMSVSVAADDRNTLVVSGTMYVVRPGDRGFRFAIDERGWYDAAVSDVAFTLWHRPEGEGGEWQRVIEDDFATLVGTPLTIEYFTWVKIEGELWRWGGMLPDGRAFRRVDPALSRIPRGHEVGFLAVPVTDAGGLDDSFDFSISLEVL